MSTHEQREKWARNLGWRCEKNAPDAWRPECWVSPKGHCHEDGLPDFSDIRGAYFGPAMQELIENNWVPDTLDADERGPFLYRWALMEPMGKIIANADLGICTMEALHAKRAHETA